MAYINLQIRARTMFARRCYALDVRSLEYGDVSKAFGASVAVVCSQHGLTMRSEVPKFLVAAHLDAGVGGFRRSAMRRRRNFSWG
jgi:hypothetical protein